MGRNVYYPADVRNALMAAEQSASAAFDAIGGKNDPFANGYAAGYRAALITVALAFGFPPEKQTGDGLGLLIRQLLTG